jgi:hypothetical protein
VTVPTLCRHSEIHARTLNALGPVGGPRNTRSRQPVMTCHIVSESQFFALVGVTSMNAVDSRRGMLLTPVKTGRETLAHQGETDGREKAAG